MRRSATFIALTALAAACSAEPGPTPIEVARNPVINGTRETGYAGVVFVQAGMGACSGTVLGPHVVLTAKHCVMRESSEGSCDYTPLAPSAFVVAVADDVVHGRPTAVFDVTEVRTTPGMDVCRDINNGNDVALLLIRDTITTEYYAVAAPSDGDSATIVGFGRTMTGTPNPMDAGVKYRGSTSIVYVDSTLVATIGSSWTCQGDSGGPLFDSGGLVVGVTSFGFDGSCRDSRSVYTRADRWSSLIGEALAWVPPCVADEMVEASCDGRDNDCDGVVDEGCATLGTACADDLTCSSGLCRPAGDGGASICTKACDPVALVPACPLGYHCMQTGCGMGLCSPGEGGGGPDGDPCTIDNDCATAHCVTVGDQHTCGTPCSAGMCADGQVCDTGGAACGVCKPAGMSTGPHGVGEPCSANPDCASTTCRSDSTGSYCTRACGDGCPSGYRCREGLCARGEPSGPGGPCVDDMDCREGTRCTAVGADRFCAVPCEAGGCSLGLECLAGQCVPPGAELGQPCADFHDCRTSLCAAVDGAQLCVRYCGSSEPCPDGFDCASAGDRSLCVPAAPAPRATHTGTGCSATSRGGSGLGAGGILLLALALAGGRRRNRSC